MVMHCLINMKEDNPVIQTLNNLTSNDETTLQASPGAETDVDSDFLPPPTDDLLTDLHPEHQVRALQQCSYYEDQKIIKDEITNMYVMTRSQGKSLREQDDSELQIKKNAPHVAIIPMRQR